jgi:hypothetical protein
LFVCCCWPVSFCVCMHDNHKPPTISTGTL